MWGAPPERWQPPPPNNLGGVLNGWGGKGGKNAKNHAGKGLEMVGATPPLKKIPKMLILVSVLGECTPKSCRIVPKILQNPTGTTRIAPKPSGF